MSIRFNPLALSIGLLFGLSGLFCPLNSYAQGSSYTVHSGYDLFQTVASGTSFGGFTFMGDPLKTFQFAGQPAPVNVGLTDTIMQRLDNVTVAGAGDTGTTNLQLVALQLESQQQVAVVVAGHTDYYHLFATLSPTTPSTGSMNITFDSPTGGTWNSSFNVYMDLHLGTPTGPIVDKDYGFGSGPILLQMSTTSNTNTWQHDPPAGAELIDGINHNLNGTNTDQDFWQIGMVMHDASGANHHTTMPAFASVPEASTVLGFGGLVAFGSLCLARKRKK